MSGDVEFGKCDICKEDHPLSRKYFNYGMKCECHSPQHFEIVRYCKDCKPVEPKTTRITIKTENLSLMAIPCAMKVLRKALREDEDYLRGWQANIAMAFKDEIHREGITSDNGRSLVSSEVIHKVANKAALDFLTILIK